MGHSTVETSSVHLIVGGLKGGGQGSTEEPDNKVKSQNSVISLSLISFMTSRGQVTRHISTPSQKRKHLVHSPDHPCRANSVTSPNSTIDFHSFHLNLNSTKRNIKRWPDGNSGGTLQHVYTNNPQLCKPRIACFFVFLFFQGSQCKCESQRMIPTNQIDKEQMSSHQFNP